MEKFVVPKKDKETTREKAQGREGKVIRSLGGRE